VSRVPVHRRALGLVRVLATVVISGIAGWVSYWHMTAVASRYGEVGTSPYLLPISVDGLIVVASISLVELAGRVRRLEDEQGGTGVMVPSIGGVSTEDSPGLGPVTGVPVPGPAPARVGRPMIGEITR
jgi:hypothetical protein